MKLISPLSEIHKSGLYGDYDGKNQEDLIKISEVTNLSIFQVVQLNEGKNDSQNLNISGLKFPRNPLTVVSNNETRILWQGPKNWLILSKNRQKDLLKELNKLDSLNYAVTDISHSKTIIQLEGKKVLEVLKKGCPINIDQFKMNNSFNSIYNGITITVDILQEGVEKIRIYSLRSFGESLYHSLTDSSLEFGYKNI
jgi:heterotetrameric sarcosine oxidase gamma subunit